MQTTYIDMTVRHWTKELKLKSSTKLQEGWIQFEQAVYQIDNNLTPWRVVQLPTGSGKTVALKMLCACQSLSRASGIITDYLSTPGVLIVTPFYKEADKLAAGINQLAGRPTARAVHRKAPAEGEDLSIYPVLIITHSAYRLALKELTNTGQGHRWEKYKSYHQASRQWLVIDEAFDWVDAYDIDLANLRSMCGDLVGSAQGMLRDDIDRLLKLGTELAGSADADHGDSVLSAKQFCALSNIDLERIEQHVRKLPDDAPVKWESTAALHHTLRIDYLKLLEELRVVVRIGFAWRSRRSGKAVLHSSQSLLGRDKMRGIILDATASTDRTYDLMGDQVELLHRPQGIRRYENVTLHVSRGHRVGKEHLSKAVNTEWAVLWGELSKELAGKKPLICAHKDVLPTIQSYEHGGCEAQFTNWGNIDGRNDWADCDAAVLFGLPYLDDIAPTHKLFAFQGSKDAEWFTGERRFGEHTDIRSALKDSFIARSVVQVINRIRCRRPIDAEGNCEPCNVYVLLPDGGPASTVLAAIRHEMPGIQFAEWSAYAARKKARKVATEEKLLRHLKEADAGAYPRSEIVQQLGIRGNTLERMVKNIRDQTSTLARGLTELGVIYRSGSGRGNEAYFVKA